MDAWTSPNHKAFVAVTVHFKNDGVPVCFLLDLVEVVVSHSGLNLVAAFAKILGDFGISDKVSWQRVLRLFHLKYYLPIALLLSICALLAITLLVMTR